MKTPRRMGWVVALLPSFFVVASCIPGSSHSFAFNSQRVVSGSVDLSASRLTGSDRLAISLVDREGKLTEPQDLVIDSAGGFRFLLRSGDIHTDFISGTLPERWARQGDSQTSYDVSPGKLGAKEVGYVRLVFAEKKPDASADTFLQFQQLVFSVTQEMLTTSGVAPIALSPGVVLNRVGRVRVKVDTPNPLGAEISPIPLGQDTEGNPLWKSWLYRPVLSLADAKGEAWVYPVPENGVAFQIYARQAGYCGKVIQPRSLSSDLVRLPLSPCGESGVAGVSWSADFAGNVIRKSETENVALVNESQVLVEIGNRGNELRGLVVTVCKDREASDTTCRPRPEETCLPSQTFERFVSDVQVSLPQTFQEGTSQNGKFAIILTSTLSKEDQRNALQPPCTILFGIKDTDVPQLRAESFVVESSAGTSATLSMAVDATFLVKHPSCGKGEQHSFREISVSVGDFSSESKFFACDNGVATIPANAVRGSLTLEDGTHKVAFKIKDAYGNTGEVSDEAPSEQVLVDSTPPSFLLGETLTVFQLYFGFVNKSDGEYSQGTFASSIEIGKADVLAGKIIFRFKKNGEECLLQDEKIAKYAIASSREKLEATGQMTRCGDEVVLSADAISLPASAAENAKVYLKSMDKAGNLSAVAAYDIPPCGADPAPMGVCWRDN